MTVLLADQMKLTNDVLLFAERIKPALADADLLQRGATLAYMSALFLREAPEELRAKIQDDYINFVVKLVARIHELDEDDVRRKAN